MILKKVIIIASLCVFFSSCSNEEEQVTDTKPLGAYDNGVLILNQGNFGQDNASISYLSNDFAAFQQSAFSAVNPTKILGNTAQDIGFYNDLAFIVLNVSNKIEIVNRYTLEYIATINQGLDNPRYITFSNGKGYVTNWGSGSVTSDDYVAVVNLSNYTVTQTISVAEGPEKILENNGNLFIAHKGGFGYGNTVSIISAASNLVTASILVGDVPNAMQIKNDQLYVLCGGKEAWTQNETIGKLVKINLANTNMVSSKNFPTGAHPSNLIIKNETIFYTENSNIFSMDINATNLPTSAMFNTVGQGVYGIYSFAVANNKIYIGDAGDYNSNGKVYIYALNGTLENQYTVGVIPAGFYFN